MAFKNTLEVLNKNPPTHSVPQLDTFLITPFLIAIASGMRVWELANIDQKAISFAPGSSSATLTVIEGFLYNNQSSTRSPPNIVIPALGENSNLCPVSALKLYINKTDSAFRRSFSSILSWDLN